MIYGKKVLKIPETRKEIKTVNTKKDYTIEGTGGKVDYTSPENNELFKTIGG